MEPNRVVARYTNGKVVKGFMLNFFPNKDRFHVIPSGKPSEQPVEVILHHLKAIFVVRNFEGDPDYIERQRYIEGETPEGIPLEVTFEDGEVLVGSSTGFNPERAGFFISPADPMSNNIRVFIVTSAVKRIRYLLLGEGQSVEVPMPRRRYSSKC